MSNLSNGPFILQVANAPLQFTQGDQVDLAFTAVNGSTPVSLTSASFSTQINGPNGIGPIVFGNSQHTANSDQVNFTGQFLLSLSNTDTNACGEGMNKEIITTITLGTGEILNFRGVGILNVYSGAAYP